MAIIRLLDGSDIKVKMDTAAVLKALRAGATDNALVDVETEEGTVHVRASSIMAIFDSKDRKTSGFVSN